jgi:TP901 family phage tail tape measure protein
MTSTETVANAVTAALKAFPGMSTAQTMDIMTKTVSTGKTEWNDYANVVGKVSVNASQAGVKFTEANAAFAILTNVLPGSKAAADSVNALMQTSSRFDTLTTRAEKLGIAFDVNKYKSLDFLGKLRYLQEATHGNSEAMTKLLGRQNAAAAVTSLLTAGASDYSKALNGITNSAGAANEAFATTQQGFQAQLANAKAAIDVLMVRIGTALLPVLGQLVGAFTAVITGSSGLTSFFQMLGNSWAEFASMLDTGETNAAFKQFVQTVQQVVAQVTGLLGPFVNNINNLLISIAGYVYGALGPALQIARQYFAGWGQEISAVILAADKIIPVIQGIVAAIAPVIISILQWIADSNIIPIVFAVITTAINIVSDAFSILVTAISGIIDFFTKTEIGGALLKATLIALAVPVGILAIAFISLAIEAIAGFIMAIPGMVAGFIAGAAGAWSMAMGVLALTWPILAVIAVIALIILAVQHWGQIVDWLKAAWGVVAGFFVGVWNHIVDGLKAAWNTIVTVVKIGIMVMLAIIFAPIVLVAALFIWLYQHNTYFKKLVDAIVGFVQFGISWLRQAWQDVVNWLAALWQSIVGIATNVWNTITSAIHTAFNAVLAVITSVWQTISGIFVSAWATYISGPLTTLWRNVSSVFSAAWNTYIAGPLTGIWNSVSKWFSDLGTSAMNSGKNFITMLVSGIKSGAGAIWNAVVGIAQNIWKALGFHSPAKEGPGSDADKWMPNLINMMSHDLMAGVPKIQAAVNLVAKPLAVMGQPAHAGVSGPVAAPAASGGGTTVIYLTTTVNAPALSRREATTLAEVITQEQSRHLRRSGNMVTQTSGGKR